MQGNFSTENPGFIQSVQELLDVLTESGMLIPVAGFFLLMLVAIFSIVRGAWNGMSLASKEFREQSARKRTYVIRTVYAVLAFGGAFFLSFEQLRHVQAMGMDALGQGRELFSTFCVIQFVGIYLFTPAMTCSLLTSEKERDTFSLLMLTRLNPWGLVLGKLISRVVPMLLFASLSMPLCAFAYSLGGVDQAAIVTVIYVMCLAVLQCAALGVMCSAIFRTTVGAFIASYLFGFMLLFGLPLLDELFRYSYSLNQTLSSIFGGTDFLGFRDSDTTAMFFAPYLVFKRPWIASSSIWLRVLQSLPIIVSIISMLYIARYFVIRRAFAQPRNLLLSLFRLVDRLFVKANDRFGGGVVLTKRDTNLPDNDPIAWRETTKRTMGTLRYLIRILVGLEFPVAFVCGISVSLDNGKTESVSVLLIILWIISLLLLSASSASLVSKERSHQTLDVLLTTPMTNRQILRQKFIGVRRLMLVLSIPFMTIFLFESWLKTTIPSLASNTDRYSRSPIDHGTAVMVYFVGSAATTFIYFHFVAMIAALIGLKTRSQSKAIFATLGTIVGWCVLPLLVLMPMRFSLGIDEETLKYLSLISPASIVPLVEFHGFRNPIFGIGLNTLI